MRGGGGEGCEGTEWGERDSEKHQLATCEFFYSV